MEVVTEGPSRPPAGPAPLEAALAYTARGWRVFPLYAWVEGKCTCGKDCATPAKHPRTKDGFKNATTDDRQVRRWWSGSRPSNVGIATGPVSGLVVLDVDPRHGGDQSLAALVAEHGSLPPTLTVRTGGGGQHLYFQHPGGAEPVRNSNGTIGEGLDVRGDGGYVVAPPSSHESGRSYEWAEGSGAAEGAAPTPLPIWLLKLITQSHQSKRARARVPGPGVATGEAAPSSKNDGIACATGSRYGLAALESEIAEVLATGEGKRNDRLNRAAFSLGQLVAGGELPADVVEARLLSAALAAGLREDESPRTIRSGLDAGQRQPRRAPEGNGHHAPRPGPAAAAAPLTEATEEPWPAPRPLPALEVEPPPLPGDLLPSALRPWLEDAAERISVPLEFVAMPGLVSLGSVVGRACGIRPKQMDDWTVVPNLWGAIVSGPGKMKSAAASEGTRPLRRLVANAAKEYRDRMEANRQTIEILQARREGLKARVTRLTNQGKDFSGVEEELRSIDEKLTELCRPERRYIIADATTAKLAALLADNPRGLCLLRDELAGLFLSMTRSGCEGDREFYLEAWNGIGSHVVDRIGRGTIYVPSLCLSVFGSIQPGKLRSFIEEATGTGSGADGLLQRLQLLVWPGNLGPFVNVDRYPNAPARDTAYRVFERLSGVIPTLERDEERSIPYLRFAPDAQELFYVWRAELETRLRAEELKDAPAFTAHLAKYRSLIAALSLLLHLAECAGAGEDPGLVSLASVRRAADFIDYLEIHARRVYAVEVNREAHVAHDLLRHLREGHADSGTPVRDLQRRGWSGLSTQDAVAQALRLLEEHGWVRLVEDRRDPRGGRPSKKVLLHPDLRGGA